MRYDLILVGGTGAQFGHAVFESVGMGLVSPPTSTYVVDADQGYLKSTLTPLFDATVKSWFEAQPPGTVQGSPVLKHMPPYGHLKKEFTITDLIGGGALSPVSELALTSEEANYTLKDGLYGMAKVGGMAIGLDRTKSNPAEQLFPSALLRELKNCNDGTAPIVIAGSTAGGTGAGFMLPLVQAIREKSAENALASRPVYVLQFLPWFDLPPNTSPVGPSNQRMRRNASQGVRFAKNVVEAPHIRNGAASTWIFILGMPPGTQMPARTGGQSSEPGTLLYYGVSLLSGDFRELKEASVTLGSDRRSGVFTLRCHNNRAGKPVFTEQLRFSLAEQGGKPGFIPFDVADRLLNAQAKALATLANKDRYKSAFGRIADDRGSLPDALFDGIKKGRDSTAERHKVGFELADVCQAASLALKRRAEELRTRLGREGNALSLTDASHLVVDAWSERNLADPHKLHEALLASDKDCARKIREALSEGRYGQAYAYIVRTLCDGLSRADDIRKSLATAPASIGQACAIPMDLPAPSNSQLLVPIDAHVDNLALELVRGDLPDSQCVPSPMAKAHILEFYINRAEQITSPLSATPEGRCLLVWLGVSSGRWTIEDRICLRNSTAPFDRALWAQEQHDGVTPYVSEWMQLVRAPDGALLAATSPRIGFCYSVRVDETPTNPLLGQFELLERELNADGSLRKLQFLYRAFADAAVATFPELVAGGARISAVPWLRLLQLWTQGVGDGEAHKDLPENGYWGQGPIALQTRVMPTGESEIRGISIPRLMTRAKRERAAALVATVCTLQMPNVLQVNKNNGVVDFKLVHPATKVATNLFAVRAFGTNGTIPPADDLQAGGLALLSFNEDGPLSMPMVAQEWSSMTQQLVQLQLATAQRIRQPKLSLFHLLRLLGDKPATKEAAVGLGLDELRLSACDVSPSLTAPGLVNLFHGLPWA